MSLLAVMAAASRINELLVELTPRNLFHIARNNGDDWFGPGWRLTYRAPHYDMMTDRQMHVVIIHKSGQRYEMACAL